MVFSHYIGGVHLRLFLQAQSPFGGFLFLYTNNYLNNLQNNNASVAQLDRADVY